MGPLSQRLAALALFAAVCLPAVPAYSAATEAESCVKAYQENHLAAWGLTRGRWDGFCAQGHTPKVIVDQTRAAFADECGKRYLKYVEQKKIAAKAIEADCGAGRPGEARLREKLGLEQVKYGEPGEQREGKSKTDPGEKKHAVAGKELSAVPKFSRETPLTKALLDKTFTGAAKRGELGGAPPTAVSGRPGGKLPEPALAPDIAGKPGLRTKDVPKSEIIPRVSDAAIAKYIYIDAGDKGEPEWKRKLRYALGDSKLLGPALETEQQKFVKQVIGKLQESEEGRRILNDVVQEAKLAGRQVTIRAEDFAGSVRMVDDGVETVRGLRGTANSANWTYTFNKKFMDYENREQALETMAVLTGHELQHIRWNSGKKRDLPEYADILHYDLGNEKEARLKGALIAVELNKGTPNAELYSAANISRNPDGYWADMKMVNGNYARSLEPQEMADPIGTYERRLKRLEDHQKETEEMARLEIPARLAEIAHLEQDHGLKSELGMVRGYYESSKEFMPGRVEKTQKTIDYIRQQLDYMKRNPQLVAKLKRAAADENYALIAEENARDEEKLAGLLATKTLPPKTLPQGVWSRAQFYEFVESDRHDHPEHWYAKNN
ncbi:MAG: hypothetical protein ABIJ96_03785 [Elusimicrobiota bacterium]